MGVVSKHCGQSTSSGGLELLPDRGRPHLEPDRGQPHSEHDLLKNQHSPASVSGTEGALSMDHRNSDNDRRHRKKHRDSECDAKDNVAPQFTADDTSLSPLGRSILDKKKPSPSSVEEVRTALGCSPTHGRLPSP